MAGAYAWLIPVASVVTIPTVAASAAKYFLDKKVETTRASKNPHLELEDTLASLDAEKFPADLGSEDIKNHGGNYKKRTLWPDLSTTIFTTA